MRKDAKIYVAGHRGMVGQALMRRLEREGYAHLITRSHAELDLTCQADVNAFFAEEQPEIVLLAAAKVGGILANSEAPAEFMYQNLMIGGHVIHAAYTHGVTRLINLGSSCIYPKFAPQPIPEDALLTGELEPTNDAYALAKIAAIGLCRSYNRQYGTDFLSLQPTNLYGPHDNFDLHSSHVLPAMIRKFHDAKVHGGVVTLWGDGSVYREFMHVDDLADAILFLCNFPRERITHDLFNAGIGRDGTIRELAETIAGVVGFTGEVQWDTSRPNGTPRKLLDVSRMRELGWEAQIPLREGIASVYEWFLAHEVPGC